MHIFSPSALNVARNALMTLDNILDGAYSALRSSGYIKRIVQDSLKAHEAYHPSEQKARSPIV
jgi:hypothetical protein